MDLVRLFSLLALLLGAAVASADPHEYVAGAGDVAALCDDPGQGRPGVGGVCIPSSHLGISGGSRLSLTLSDLGNNPTAGWFCQNPNNDAICGGSGEPLAPICNAVIVTAPSGWIKSVDVVVRAAGPIYGKVLNNCPSPIEQVNFGTSGYVTHAVMQ